ncbi:MAG: NUDIX domain-containing protein [Deltaproteobacteria bacterium]|nr:NUDIX domain-containing protein [Deltaproteobacteria bacterium]
MITLRPMTTAFILNGESILMIKRSLHKELHPGKWAGIGGHIEMEEFKKPQYACLREINEETGLKEHDLSNLELRYIVLSRESNEIRQQFIYFAFSLKREIHSSGEGELKWILKKDVMKLEMPPSHRMVLNHYLDHKGDDPDVFVGTKTINPENQQVQWHLLNQ